MKKKNAIAFWYNLKGNYDITIFDNKRNLNKFAKQYKEIYTKFENEELTFDEFTIYAENLAEDFSEKIIKIIDEVYSRDIEEDEIFDKYIIGYINGEKTKIILCEILDYGF